MRSTLENDSETISASEVNRYVYCPYQWYYERVYGRKELRRLRTDRNKELGLTDGTASHLKKGLEYHKMEYRRFKFKKFLMKATIILGLCLVIYFFIRMKFSV